MVIQHNHYTIVPRGIDYNDSPERYVELPESGHEPELDRPLRLAAERILFCDRMAATVQRLQAEQAAWEAWLLEKFGPRPCPRATIVT